MLSCCVHRNFYVVVVPLKKTPGTVKDLKNPDEIDIEEVAHTISFQAVFLFVCLFVILALYTTTVDCTTSQHVIKLETFSYN